MVHVGLALGAVGVRVKRVAHARIVLQGDRSEVREPLAAEPGSQALHLSPPGNVDVYVRAVGGRDRATEAGVRSEGLGHAGMVRGVP
eukprot:364603-Prorocentrum_minimum.AAC.3